MRTLDPDKEVLDVLLIFTLSTGPFSPRVSTYT
jgi:hypothetical protein